MQFGVSADACMPPEWLPKRLHYGYGKTLAPLISSLRLPIFMTVEPR